MKRHIDTNDSSCVLVRYRCIVKGISVLYTLHIQKCTQKRPYLAHKAAIYLVIWPNVKEEHQSTAVVNCTFPCSALVLLMNCALNCLLCIVSPSGAAYIILFSAQLNILKPPQYHKLWPHNRNNGSEDSEENFETQLMIFSRIWHQFRYRTDLTHSLSYWTWHYERSMLGSLCTFTRAVSAISSHVSDLPKGQLAYCCITRYQPTCSDEPASNI